MLIFFVKIPKHYTEHPHDYLEQGPTHPPLDITLEHSKGKQPSHGNLPGHGTSTTELSIYFTQQRKLKPYSFLLEKKKTKPNRQTKEKQTNPSNTPQKSNKNLIFSGNVCNLLRKLPAMLRARDYCDHC